MHRLFMIVRYAKMSKMFFLRTVVELYHKSWARDNFLASRQQQRDNVIEPHGQEQIQKIFRSRCLDGVPKEMQ